MVESTYINVPLLEFWGVIAIDFEEARHSGNTFSLRIHGRSITLTREILRQVRSQALLIG
jgi:hypothetical protein